MSHLIKSFLWKNKLVFMDFGEFFFFAPVNIFKLVMDQLTMYNVKGVVHNLMNQQRMHRLSGSPQCYGAS